MNDTKYMRIAIELAKKGYGKVNPNPLVGAVVVKNDEILGEGYHKYFGGPHAERNAIANCKVPLEGSTIYVNLEPCCHYGKTPPCTQAIIENKIKRVVIGSIDPNMKVNGAGIKLLEDNGIQVTVGVLKEECEKLNKVFFNFLENKTPYVTMKYAMTMDGKIATQIGKSKWISGKLAREDVHRDRNKNMAIMVGMGTVIKDNPMLTCRIEGGENPIRVICDTNLRTPLESKIVNTANRIKTIIATSVSEKDFHRKYLEKGCDILTIPKYKEHIDLKILMEELANINIDSVFLEGGGTINYSALEQKIVNEVKTYISPKIFGGEKAKTPVEGTGILEVSESYRLKILNIENIGEDILIESEVHY